MTLRPRPPSARDRLAELALIDRRQREGVRSPLRNDFQRWQIHGLHPRGPVRPILSPGSGQASQILGGERISPRLRE